MAVFGLGRTWAKEITFDEVFCRNGSFPHNASNFGQARVVGDRAPVLEDSIGCTERWCRDYGRIHPGDVVLTGRRSRGHVCVYVLKNEFAGWVPASTLRPIAVRRQPGLQAWAGTWREHDTWIQLTVRGSSLAVRGRAYWPAKDVPPNHLGFLGSITATPKGDMMAFDYGDCHVVLFLVGSYLVARDNWRCGAPNVGFTGIYARGGR